MVAFLYFELNGSEEMLFFFHVGLNNEEYVCVKTT